MRKWLTVLTLTLTGTFVWLSLAATSAATTPSALQDELLRDATLVFQRALGAPAAAIPASTMLRAHGIAVVPTGLKDGELYYGMGVLSARGVNPERWSPPAVIAFQGAIPLDLETDIVDFVLIAVTRRGLDYLSSALAPLPIADISPGPLGQDTRVNMHADILSYMQFGDYFAGVTIERWSITEMKTSNARLYGRPYSSDEILRGAGFFNLPPGARLWRDALASYFREMS